MRLGKILKYILIGVPVLLIALVAVALVVLMTTDFNKYKPLIAEETKKATGRDLVIAGDLSLVISLTPAVAVNGVTLSNAKWGSRPEMVKVERFEAQISVLPLLTGTVLIDRVVLIGADILLEVDKQGRANFEFETAKAPAAEPAKKPEAAPADGGQMDIPVGIREIVIRDSRLTYSDAKAGARHKAAIDSLTLRGEGLHDPIKLAFQGSYNDAAIKLAATLGAPAEAMAPTKPWPIDLTLEAGGATISVKGSIAKPMEGKGIDLALAVDGNELGDLSALAGAEVPKMGAYSLAARLSAKDPAKALKLADMKAAIAGTDLAGDVTVKLDGKRPSIDAKLASRMIDLDRLGGGGGEAAPAAAAQPAAKSDRMFPDDPLPLDGLKSADANLQLEAGTIVVSGAKLETVVLKLVLANGKLSIAPLRAGIADGTIDGAITLDGSSGKAAALAVKLGIDKVDLDKLLTEMKITEDVEGRGNIDVDIAGNGRSVRAIMASLDGSAGLLMGEGRMKDTLLQSLLGGAGGLANAVLDKGKSGYTAVNCAVVAFDIKDGLATAKAIYLDTETYGVIGSGTANLGSETLDLVVDPRKKRSMEKPVLPIRIKGTFMVPKYNVDKAVVATKIGKLLGAQLPPALGGGTSSGGGAPLIEGPCAPPAPAEQPATQAPAQQPAPAPAAPVTPQDAVKDLKKGLQGLFGQ